MNQSIESVTVQIGGAQVIVPKDAAVRAFLEHVLSEVPATMRAAGAAPQIGQAWSAQGGIYAGVARGQNGEPDYHLIVADEWTSGVTWQNACEFAATLRVDKPVSGSGCFKDFELPRRHEQAILYGNVPELFQSAWYWSDEQHASDSTSAWCQYFGYGLQSYFNESSSFRARAVRRVVI